MNCINRPNNNINNGSNNYRRSCSRERRRHTSSKSKYGKPYTVEDSRDLLNFHKEKVRHGPIPSDAWWRFQRERFPNRTVEGLKRKLFEILGEQQRRGGVSRAASHPGTQVSVVVNSLQRNQLKIQKTPIYDARQASVRRTAQTGPLTPPSSQDTTELPSSPPALSDIITVRQDVRSGSKNSQAVSLRGKPDIAADDQQVSPILATTGSNSPLFVIDMTRDSDSFSIGECPYSPESNAPVTPSPSPSRDQTAPSSSDLDSILENVKQKCRSFAKENTALWADPEIARGVKGRREFREWKKKGEDIQKMRRIFDEFHALQEKEAENQELRDAKEARFRTDEQVEIDDLKKSVSRARKRLKRDINGLTSHGRAQFKQICPQALPKTH